MGGGFLSLAQVAVALLSRFLDPTSYRQAIPDLLLFSPFAGILIASTFGWRRSRPLHNLWQSGVIAVLSAVGALLVGFLAVLVHHPLGLAGLLVWAALALGFGVAGSRWAIRGSGTGGGTGEGGGGGVLP